MSDDDILWQANRVGGANWVRGGFMDPYTRRFTTKGLRAGYSQFGQCSDTMLLTVDWNKGKGMVKFLIRNQVNSQFLAMGWFATAEEAYEAAPLLTARAALKALS